jgi:hypothetical protein
MSSIIYNQFERLQKDYEAMYSESSVRLQEHPTMNDESDLNLRRNSQVEHGWT